MRRSPVHGGILRAAHETEVPFVFGTAAAAPGMVGTGPDLAWFEQLMITTWSRFAWTGSPDNRMLPHWRRHVPGSDAAMLLNRPSAFGQVPGSAARAGLSALPVYEYGMPSNFLNV
jgi:para-nitrobenzyl esterase